MLDSHISDSELVRFQLTSQIKALNLDSHTSGSEFDHLTLIAEHDDVLASTVDR